MGGKATKSSGRLCKSGGVSGNYQGGAKSVSQVNVGLRYDACLLARLGEGSIKEQWHLPALQSLETAALTLAPPAFTKKLVILVLAHVPGILQAVAPALELRTSESTWTL